MDEQEFRKNLSPEQYRVMRQRGDETPYSGMHWDRENEGVYSCAACGTELFSSEEKFDSKTGWPSFHEPIDANRMEYKRGRGSDDKIEVRCRKCKSHLGYVVDGEKKYFRMNSLSLHFEEAEDGDDDYDKKDDAGSKTGFRKYFDGNGAHVFAKSAPIFLAGAIVGVALGAIAGVYVYSIRNTTPTRVSITTSSTTLQIIPLRPGVKATTTSAMPLFPAATATNSSAASPIY